MALQLRSSLLPAPVSLTPSQSFQGSDGSWSTFLIYVGNPPQSFNILISTVGQETWVPSSGGCTSKDPNNCGVLRGVQPFRNQPSNGFKVNESSTWEEIGNFRLGLGKNLNYTGIGSYGFDTVGLGLPNNGGPTLDHQIVAATASKDFYLGLLSLGPKPTNFTDFNDPQPSFMWSLKNRGIIPSISFGYTAGAPYRLKKIPGSLTLGGYDASLLTPNEMKFSFGSDDSRVLIVGLQSIHANNTLQGEVSLLPSGVLSLIDSSVPEIWLPESACFTFEAAFGLEFDANTNRYLVNDSTHIKLTILNPTLTFKLGNDIEGEGVEISLPYQAFDLQASYPIYPNPTNYFPLRRAANDTQYTLGRTFLQEAYVVADYERSQFSVSQSVFKENNPISIVTVYPLGMSPPKAGLRIAVVIGISVTSVVGVLLIATSLLFFFRARRKKQSRISVAKTIDNSTISSPYTHDTFRNFPETPVCEVVGHKILEMGVNETPVELMGGHMSHELTFKEKVELVGGDMRHELPCNEVVAELPARGYERWSFVIRADTR